ncbi:LacI family DNA-binding transcriptional regulator [Brachybacterium squillarum]|uniref:LacI family DNA-binding transcriptional regulator n=1 Tax=Brachybacterium squillarum TaxID=661979 RepID=UPI001FE04105|nr:LacI family DNA-binding transcriptional regulator [Brachybacterium squillarum]
MSTNPQGPRVTMLDVARAAGVSRALVSLAYRDAHGVSPRTRERILARGEELGYVPDRMAASLASRGVGSVGVHLQDLHNDVFALIHDGIRAVMEHSGRDLVLSVGDLEGARDLASLRALQGARVGTVIAAGLLLPDAELRAFAARTPVVSVARAVEGVDSVCTDNALGARLATEHLLALGHRRLVFLANPPSDGYLDRRRGFEAAVAGAGLSPRTVGIGYDRDGAAAATARLLDGEDPPTAVFAHNDRAALGVLDVAVDRGLVPGRDLSVVGYDNSSPGRAPGTALTTVDLRAEELGRVAARIAGDRMEHPEVPVMQEVLEPRLVVRGTAGPPA